MKTAIDTSVLLDVLSASREYGGASRRALRDAFDRGALIVCDVVWSEVRTNFPSSEGFLQAMKLLSVEFDALTPDAAEKAGELWRSYCLKHRSSQRDRVVADFLVGAHALIQADVLLTRDRGFYREMFDGLRIVDPSRSDEPIED